MDLEFSGEMWFWRGPSPWHFVTVPEDGCRELEATASFVSYGWGMIPVTARIGETRWTTSLFPKDGHYIVPVKAGVRQAEGLDVGDTVTIRLTVGARAQSAKFFGRDAAGRSHRRGRDPTDG
jgi:Domain of unknown function (DUF1905)